MHTILSGTTDSFAPESGMFREKMAAQVGAARLAEGLPMGRWQTRSEPHPHQVASIEPTVNSPSNASPLGLDGRQRRDVLRAAWIPGEPEDEAAYLLVLSNALLDRQISRTEGLQLAATAREAGLTRSTVARLHRDFLRSVALEALADGVVTVTERHDLDLVASAIGLASSDVEEALEWAGSQDASIYVAGGFALSRGDLVVFTGEMRRPRDEWIADIVSAGLTSGGITKSTRVVVAADPDSLSGKAGRARQYGVPLVDEETFSRLFNDYRGSVGADSRQG